MTTTTPIRLLGIGGTARAGSISRNVLANVLQMAASDPSIETHLISVRDLDLPIYNEDIPYADQPQALKDLLEEMKRADGFLLASPTYHGSIGGGIKNALDALHLEHGAPGTYFDGRPVGLIAYGGASAINVITALIHSARGIRGLVVPTALTVSRDQLDPERTEIVDANTRQRATTMLAEVIRLARLLKDARERIT